MARAHPVFSPSKSPKTNRPSPWSTIPALQQSLGDLVEVEEPYSVGVVEVLGINVEGEPTTRTLEWVVAVANKAIRMMAEGERGVEVAVSAGKTTINRKETEIRR